MTSVMRHAIRAHAGTAGLRGCQVPLKQSNAASFAPVGGEAGYIYGMTPARLTIVESDLFNQGKVIPVGDVVNVAGILGGGHFNPFASGVLMRVMAHGSILWDGVCSFIGDYPYYGWEVC